MTIVVLTGALDRLAREETTARRRALGATVSDSESTGTRCGVVGRDPGSKLDRARWLGVPRLREAAFPEYHEASWRGWHRLRPGPSGPADGEIQSVVPAL